jgi:hypothetical protein
MSVRDFLLLLPLGGCILLLPLLLCSLSDELNQENEVEDPCKAKS